MIVTLIALNAYQSCHCYSIKQKRGRLIIIYEAVFYWIRFSIRLLGIKGVSDKESGN